MKKINKVIDPAICDEEIIKFYELHNRLSNSSLNIGVTGNFKEFNEKVKNYVKNIFIDRKYIRNDGHIITYFAGDIEMTFIHIECLQDLYGRNFRKYI